MPAVKKNSSRREGFVVVVMDGEKGRKEKREKKDVVCMFWSE